MHVIKDIPIVKMYWNGSLMPGKKSNLSLTFSGKQLSKLYSGWKNNHRWTGSKRECGSYSKFNFDDFLHIYFQYFDPALKRYPLSILVIQNWLDLRLEQL